MNETAAGNVFFHTLDPRTKILLSLFLTLVIFAVSRLLAAAGLAVALLTVWLAAKIPLKKITVYLKFLLLTIFFITLMQMLFGPGDHYIVKPLIPQGVPLIGGLGSLKRDGLVLGFVSGLRLLSLVLLLPLLTGTTSMYKLAQGLTALRLNYRAAYIISTAINLIPALEEEARLIIDAQKLRGLHVFDEGKLRQKLKAYPALAVPLIISAMRRSQSMSYAMDSRAFGAYPCRTWREPLKMKTCDFYVIAVTFIFCSLLLIINFMAFRDFTWL